MVNRFMPMIHLEARETKIQTRSPIISTSRDVFDWELLEEHARAIVDARGVFRHGPENFWQA